ncbi:Ubiquitin carboxyl-terminal hydrolase 33 [Aphelenchoides besseyi]|nr:Ubiquitin carboxyl-terminal hydrolase 33 [Aphelenchoides besseyi]
MISDLDIIRKKAVESTANGHAMDGKPEMLKWNSSILNQTSVESLTNNNFHQLLPKSRSGLPNLGNTCFFNAVLQCLINTPQFTYYLETVGKNEELRLTQDSVVTICDKKVELEAATFKLEPMRMPFIEVFRNFIREFHCGRSLNPRPVLDQIARRTPRFRGYQQQDAHELLRYLLDGLRNEELERFKKGIANELAQDTSEETKRKIQAYLYAIGQPCLDRVFAGTWLQHIKCLTCQHLSHTNETFHDISLSIPTQEQVEKMKEAIEEFDSSAITDADSSTYEASYRSWLAGFANRWFFQPWFSWLINFYRYMFSESITIDDCLRAFFASDHLREDNMYKCEKCDKLRNGIKQCRIKTLPEILCIHLKRFRHDHMYNTKISTRISFPLHDLDLSPYMTIDDDETPESTTYDLSAVVSHRGSSVDFGHYVAYCYNQHDDTWYEFDDSYVRTVSEAEVQAAEAYLLFYQRRCNGSLDEIDDF